MSSTTRSRPSVGSSKRNSSGGGGDSPSAPGGDLIVTRGLQDILNQDMAMRRSSGSGSSSAKRKKAAPGARSTGPNFVVCYLCGRQFGSASIDIHRPQCYLKKMIEWERGDPSLRGPRPVDPETHEKQIKARMASGGGMAGGGGGGGGARGGPKMTEIEAYNAAQFEAFTTQALAPCPNCGRTFLPDRLQVHLRSCKPGSTAKPVHRPGFAAANTTSAAAGSSSNGGPTGGGAGAGAARGKVEDHPIKASGAYHVDAAAGADAVPPGAGRSVKSPNPSQPRPVEDQPIKASGAYAMPDGSTEDSVPPGGRASSGGVVKAKSVSHRPAGRRPGGTVVQVGGAMKVDSDEDSEVALVEEVGEEAPPISPSADVVAEVEAPRRHTIAGEPGGTSTPTRWASMEPGLDDSEATDERRAEFHSHVGSERAGNTASHNARDGAGADDDMDDQPRRMSALPSAEERRRMREEKAGNGSSSSGIVVLGYSSGAEDHGNSEGGHEGEDSPKKKIPLNNVSRFKNVQSRLKLERQQQPSNLTPCQYCGRTFNPDRVAKHESCCVERNKAPAPAVNRTRKAPPGSAGGVKRPASGRGAGSVAKPMEDSAADDVPRFCGACGCKYSSAGQKFCGSCGAKCAA